MHFRWKHGLDTAAAGGVGWGAEAELSQNAAQTIARILSPAA